VIRAISERDPRVLGITHSRNFGSQMAFRSGMELSTKDGVVLLDGDLQDPPELIERSTSSGWQGMNVVYGRRVKRDMPWHWGLMYKAFYRVFAAFSYVKIPLDAGDFALMDKRVVSLAAELPGAGPVHARACGPTWAFARPASTMSGRSACSASPPTTC
jgi:glycosyltransferase involved in cell wall biosynthesis